jgi:hypothetical protein
MADSNTGPGKTRIFIIYASHEQVIAESLKGLLEAWGFEAFFCRQEHREQGTSKPYREYLLNHLALADLAIVLLSSEFQASPYCHVESGILLALNKLYIIVTIPPADYREIKHLSPVLEGFEIVDARDPRVDLPERMTFASMMKTRLADCFPAMRAMSLDTPREQELIASLNESLGTVIDRYRLMRPKRVLMNVWPSLKEDSPAPRSIIDNIKRGLARDGSSMRLAFVGVSLKFSLKLITTALEELATPGSVRQKQMPPGGKWLRETRLKIDLVHMDDQSHILHAIDDQYDIRAIRSNFHEDWQNTIKKWESDCSTAGIVLRISEPKRIDYIPPRVGILIEGDDSKVLYAGRCSVERVGGHVQLLVGEREYFFYRSIDDEGRPDDRGSRAIAEFNKYLDLYGKTSHNGVVLVPDRTAWLARLASCIETYRDLNQVTLISSTMTKLRPLVVPALQRGLTIKLYAAHPELRPQSERAAAQNLKEDLARLIRNDGRQPAAGGKVEIRHFRHHPTFRAALLGNAALGVQMYVSEIPPQEALELAMPSAGVMIPSKDWMKPSQLRLIVTKESAQFEELKQDVIDHFLRHPGVSEHPVATLQY